MSEVTVTTIPSKASSLWQYIVEAGGIDTKRYDSGLEAALASELAKIRVSIDPSVTDVIQKEPHHRGTTLGRVSAIGRTLRQHDGGSAGLFERAGAQTGKNNLQVVFDFPRASDLK